MDARKRGHGAHIKVNAALFRAFRRLSLRHVNSPLDLIAQPDALALDLPAATGAEAVRALQARLGTAGGAITDPPRLLADLIERMGVSTVCIADNIALPHARTTAVSRIVLAIGRTLGDAAFDAEHPHVRLVMLVGTPKSAVSDYLQLVAGLSRFLKNAATRAALLAAPGEVEFRALLQRAVIR